MDFGEISKLRKYLNIKQSHPGRLRIQFSNDILDDDEAIDFISSDFDLPEAITKTKLNMFSKSLLILYDPKKLPQNLLEQLLLVKDDALADNIATQINLALYS